MAINRVDLADETLIDISDSTVSADTLASGEIAYGADGEQIVGIAEFGGDTTDCYKTTDTASTSIADTDYIPLSDANGNKKKSTWSNIKTVLGNVFALKNNTVITGSLSMGRKDGTTVGNVSVALGYNCVASGWLSRAYGYNSTASGDNACHAEGFQTTASGNTSHSEGSYTTASGIYSHAEGRYSTASGNTSHSEGYNTKASSDYQHVQGKCNVEDTENKYAHIVGNGTSGANLSNAHTLDWNGNAWFAGDVESETYGKLSKKANETIVTDEWSSGSYASGSYVIYNNKLYKNTSADATTGTPSVSSDWVETKIADALTTQVGTWTPQARNGMTSYTDAYYSKFGNVVVCSAKCVFGTITATNKQYFANLPFEPATNSQIIGSYRGNSGNIGGSLIGNIGDANNRAWSNEASNTFSNDTVYICFNYICK